MKAITLIMLLLFSTLATLIKAQTATDLFISEYVEGTSNQKAIEIFNGTGATVDLSQYSLKKQTNGAGAFGDELILTGTLVNHACYVIVCSSTTGTTLEDQPYVDLATTSPVMWYNGNDCIALFKNGSLLDVVGNIGQPATWGMDITLRRISNIVSPRPIWYPAEWTTFPVNTFDNLGLHSFTLPILIAVLVISPNGGESWQSGSTHELIWVTANYNGLMKIELLQGNTTSTIVDSIPYNNSYMWTIPTNLTPGSDYRLKILCISDSGYCDTSDNTFSIVDWVPITDIPNIAALRTQPADNFTVYRLTGEAWVTYFRATRNQKYIQDNTGAVLVDDPTGIINSQYMIGDGMTNLTGKLTTYHSQYQFIPSLDPGIPTSSHYILPQAVSIVYLNAHFNEFSQELIRLNNVIFLPDSTGGIFVADRSYEITDNSGGSFIFRTNFAEADYIGMPIPGVTSFDALAIPYDAQFQVTARSLGDFLDDDDDPLALTSAPVLYGNSPNPFNGTTAIRFDAKSNNPVSIDIYNIRGQKVASIADNEYLKGFHVISWDGKCNDGAKAPSGVYLYKMQSGSYSSTKKMILLK